MATKAPRISQTESGKQATAFVKSLKAVQEKKGNILDSAGSAYATPVEAIMDSVSDIMASVKGANKMNVPENMARLYDELDMNGAIGVTEAILDSCNRYEEAHGQEVPPDLIEQFAAIANQNTRGGAIQALNQAGIFDSATVTNLLPSDTATQANRAIVSITRAGAVAVPWIASIPYDIGSSEGKLIIVDHVAGMKNGGYANQESMDGVNGGKRFFSSARITTTTNAAGAHSGQLTSVQLTTETCETVANGATAVNLLKGNARIYINGQPVAYETKDTDTVSTVSGSVTLAGVTSQIGGTINNDTGVIALTSSPALANGVTILVEGFIDFNRAGAGGEQLISEMGMVATPYKFRAQPIRASITVAIDASTQYANEVNVDPMTELMGAMQRQLGGEKHYRALDYARRLAKNNVATWDMSLWLDTGAQTRAQNIEDIAIPIKSLSQQMAINTNNTGITHGYVGKEVKSWLYALAKGGRFIPSGIKDQPNIFRIGSLDGIELYYDPRQPETTTSGVTTATILLIGQSLDVARSGIITGQCVNPILLPVGVTKYGNQGTHYFEKSFMAVNPHLPSSLSFAELTLTLLK